MYCICVHCMYVYVYGTTVGLQCINHFGLQLCVKVIWSGESSFTIFLQEGKCMYGIHSTGLNDWPPQGGGSALQWLCYAVGKILLAWIGFSTLLKHIMLGFFGHPFVTNLYVWFLRCYYFICIIRRKILLLLARRWPVRLHCELWEDMQPALFCHHLDQQGQCAQATVNASLGKTRAKQPQVKALCYYGHGFPAKEPHHCASG